MMNRYELIDKFKIVDPFKPEVTLAVVLDPSLAKEFLKAINTQHKEDKDDKSLRESLRVAKLSISKKDAKIARLEALLAEAGIQSGSTTRPKKDPNEPRKKPSYKPKKCAKCDTMFIPRSGRSYLCDSCNEAHKREVASRPRGAKTPPVLRTEIRGSGGGGGVRVAIPTVDQVMAMTDVNERAKWQARWSPAEWAESKKIQNKMMMEKMRKMRNKGFSLDDPIMGINANITGYK